jgi:signal transduction histidine kinase
MDAPDSYPGAELFARAPNYQWLNVRQIVDEVCSSLTRRFVEQRIESVTDMPRYVAAMADREMLRAAVLNLATNAVEAMPRGGRLVVTSYIGRNGLELEVADSGPGLSDEARRRAFEPYYTTKRDKTGVGLAVVRGIAQAHGGDVVAVNCPEGGAAFTLRFPPTVSRAAA